MSGCARIGVEVIKETMSVRKTSVVPQHRNLVKPSPNIEKDLRQFEEVADRLSDSLDELGITEEMAQQALRQAREEIYQETYGEVAPAVR